MRSFRDSSRRPMEQVIEEIAERVRAAGAVGGALRPVGGGTKDFYGERLEGDRLEMSELSGIIDYEPSELFVTVRAGTPLAELESILRSQNQHLAFEPPSFGAAATVGGCIASGLSGPSRMRVGPLRDFVLGVKIID